MRPRVVRASLLFLGVGTFALAVAMPPYLDLFNAHYEPPQDSALFKAKCMTCHATAAGGKGWNSYGEDLKSAIHSGGDHELTVAAFAAIESKDSDGDDASNLEEIRAGLLPGNPESNPARKEGEPTVNTPPSADLIPKHSFHPLVVHFPIGLFIFGAFLELLARWRKKPDLRKLALWNLGFGALASLVAVPTGITAWLRLGLALEGNLLIHVILASSSTLMMLGVAAWRRKGEHDNAAYWATLTLATALVAGAGHFGALQVYG